MNVGTIEALCISEKRGTKKFTIEEAEFITDYGIEHDAHAGKWHRQVSLLALEQITAFRLKGAAVDFGGFGENIVVAGFDLSNMPIGTRFLLGEQVILELTQIGKECHAHCQIFHQVGDCIMPREGVFTKVIVGGHVKKGDMIKIV